jgi:hypothetical protein
MSVITREKFKVLAEIYGWSFDYAKGLIDGETFRKRGQSPSVYAMNGIDEYSLGFRAGFFVRQTPDSRVPANTPAPGRVVEFAKPV